MTERKGGAGEHRNPRQGTTGGYLVSPQEFETTREFKARRLLEASQVLRLFPWRGVRIVTPTAFLGCE